MDFRTAQCLIETFRNTRDFKMKCLTLMITKQKDYLIKKYLNERAAHEKTKEVNEKNKNDKVSLSFRFCVS